MCTAAVFWEFAEWVCDRTFRTRLQPSLDDTLLDMLLGILGGVALLLGVGLRPGGRGHGPGTTDRPDRA